MGCLSVLDFRLGVILSLAVRWSLPCRAGPRLYALKLGDALNRAPFTEALPSNRLIGSEFSGHGFRPLRS